MLDLSFFFLAKEFNFLEFASLKLKVCLGIAQPQINLTTTEVNKLFVYTTNHKYLK